MAEGVTYTHVLAIGYDHTVLLMSDGNALLCALDVGPCNIPALSEGVTYVRPGEQMILALNFCDSHAAFCLLSGDEVCRIDTDASDTFIDVRKAFMSKRTADHGKFRVVLPSGELLSVVCVQRPSAIIEPFVVRRRRRRS